jgi:hypothetical protein
MGYLKDLYGLLNYFWKFLWRYYRVRAFPYIIDLSFLFLCEVEIYFVAELPLGKLQLLRTSRVILSKIHSNF